MGDTIFALATAQGRAGVAVVRVSGPGAFGAAAALAGRLGEPRSAALRWLRDPASGERIDQGLVIGFPGPGSFTGEDVAELQLHGSPAVARAVLAALAALPGLRLAEPGEFTRRALINGRVDLAQVEGLGDLLVAETAAQRRQALALVNGTLSRQAEVWGAGLLRALAFLEATIDFSDEELPEALLVTVRGALETVAGEMRTALVGGRIAERLRDGFEVALVGRPNVGKSTLLNALAGRDAALTSEVAGTTRDVIEVRMDLDGLPLTVLDMAGMREGGGRIERIGVARARARAARADLRLFLVADHGEVSGLGVAEEPGDIVALAKADLRRPGGALAVSGLTGTGLDALLARIAAELQDRAAGATLLSHSRQRDAVTRAAAAVEAALAELARGEAAVEVAVEEIRTALRMLDFLVGRVDVEAVLDVIFQSFCLGK